jgi:hypothetical protein
MLLAGEFIEIARPHPYRQRRGLPQVLSPNIAK